MLYLLHAIARTSLRTCIGHDVLHCRAFRWLLSLCDDGEMLDEMEGRWLTLAQRLKVPIEQRSLNDIN